MNKQAILEKVEFYWSKAKEIYKNLPDNAPVVQFFVDTKQGGFAYRFEHKVAFNTMIAELNSDTFESVISHEIAHIVQFICYPNAKQAHGPEFRKIDKAIGGTGSRHCFVQIDPAFYRNKRYVYNCVCKDHFITSQLHNKVLKALETNPQAKLVCNVCKEGLLFMNRTTKD